MIIRDTTILLTLLFVFASIVVAQQDSEKATTENQTETEKLPTKTTNLTANLKVCTAIEERMPAGETKSFSSENEQLYLWSQIIGATDSTFINHIWLYKGDTMSNVELPVRSAMWRTWSSKAILPSWTGPWEVKVFSEGGAEIESIKFEITE